jgi:hypothetical protein
VRILQTRDDWMIGRPLSRLSRASESTNQAVEVFFYFKSP